MIIALFETVRLPVSISLRNLYKSLKIIKVIDQDISVSIDPVVSGEKSFETVGGQSTTDDHGACLCCKLKKHWLR